jgi:uncharacterized protein with beta-barrel porin domain
MSKQNLKRALLLSTAILAAGMVTWPLVMPPAMAACSNSTPSMGETVTCDATTVDITGVDGSGVSDVTVNVLDLATVQTTATAIQLGDNGTLHLYGSGAISTTGNGSYVHGVFIDGDNGTIELTDSSHINTTGYRGHGAFIDGDNGTITLNDSSYIKTTGLNSSGVSVEGVNGTVTLNTSSSIVTTGNSSYGVAMWDDGSTITLNGFSSISTTGEKDFWGAMGVVVGNYGAIILNDFSSISTTGAEALGAYLDGHHSAITLNDFSSISTTGTDAHGAYITAANGTITLNGSSSITTGGDDAHGAYIGGDNSTIALNDLSTIKTTGMQGHGVFVEGDNDTVTLNDFSSIGTTGTEAFGAYITGYQSAIALNDFSSISTTGSNAHGVYVTGGNGAITLNGSSSISTKGAYAYGISISGNNGTITFNDSSSITSLGLYAAAVKFFSGSNTLVNRGTLQSVDSFAVVGASDDDNSDIVRNYGIIIGGTTAIRLRSGNDSLLLGTGSAITGDINGGDGSDILTLTGEGSEDDDFLNFETLTMSGTDWALSGASTFDNITIETGRLRVNGEIEATNITLLEADATLGGSGTLISDVASEGTIAPGNSVGTLTIDGDFMQTGGSFEAEFDQSGIDLLTVTGGAILSDSPTLTVVSLTGITSASGVILHADDGIFGTFGSIEFEGNGAAVLDYSTNDITLTVADGSPILASTQTALKTAFSFFDYAGADHETSCDKGTNDVNHDGTCRRLLWAKSFGQWGSEDAQSTTGAFDYRIAGLAVGADAMIGHGRRVGGSFGAALADDTLAQDAAETSLTSFLGALHITQNVGLAFITASLLGGLELMELSRLIATNSGVSTAEASPMGTVAGVSLEAGIDLRLSDRWTVTPSLWASYIHQWVESYEESGDATALDVDAHEASALRTKAEIKAAHATMLGATMLSPHVKLGIAVDVPMGGTASASLAGEDFEINLEDTREVSAIGGVGFDLDWSNGAKGYLSYESEMSRTATAHTLMGGVQFIW